MKDIIFKTDDYVFSYRVGGVLIHINLYVSPTILSVSIIKISIITL